MKRQIDERFNQFTPAMARGLQENGIAGLIQGTPEGIVASERAGGQALVMDAKLPLNGLAAYRERLEAEGFQFGEECGGRSNDGTSMYIECKLPDGWKKGSDPNDPYGRGSYLFDPQGRKRASMFVKETSYDRYASISFGRHWDEPETHSTPSA